MRLPHKWREQKGLLVLICLSIILISPTNGAITTQASLVIYALATISICVFVLVKDTLHFFTEEQRLTLNVCALTAWIFLSSLWSFDINSAINAAFIYGVAALLFIVLLRLFSLPSARRFWLGLYFSVAVVVGFIGFNGIFQDSVGRLQFGFVLANSAAAFFLPVTVIFLLGSKKVKTKADLLMVVGGAFASLAFIFTFSRGALICLLAALFIYGLFAYRKSKLLILSLVILLALTFAGIMGSKLKFGENKYDYITRNIFRSSSVTVHDRLIYAQSALSLFQAHPLFGSGAGSYRIIGIAHQPGAYVLSTNAHASILQFLAEFGIVGGLLLINIFVQIVPRMWAAMKDSRRRIYATAVIALAIHFAIDIDLLYPPLLFLLVSVLALAISPPNPSRALGGGYQKGL